MNCESVREHLPMLLYGELAFDEEESVEAHLDGCSDCRAALERERALSAAFDQIAVEPPPALLRECRETLAMQLAAENRALPVPALEVAPKGWWDRFVDGLTMPVMRPAGAIALVALGFVGARMAPGVLPGSFGMASIADFGAPRVRSVEPAADGGVRIVLDETRQRTMEGHVDDAEIRALLLSATKDPSDGLRAETVALLTSRAQAEDVRNALVYTVRNDLNAGVRLKALDGLKAFIGETEVRSALTDVLSSDANPAMRVRAIDLLMDSMDGDDAQVVDRRLIGVLQEMMSSEAENPYMRERCQQALELVKASSEVY